MAGLELWTGHLYRVSDPDMVDVTRKSGLPGFAPSWGLLTGYKAGRIDWPGYERRYTAEMRRSYQRDRGLWHEYASRERLVLCCYCYLPDHCHRRLLAGFLARVALSLGRSVSVRGEIRYERR